MPTKGTPIESNGMIQRVAFYAFMLAASTFLEYILQRARYPPDRRENSTRERVSNAEDSAIDESNEFLEDGQRTELIEMSRKTTSPKTLETVYS